MKWLKQRSARNYWAIRGLLQSDPERIWFASSIAEELGISLGSVYVAIEQLYWRDQLITDEWTEGPNRRKGYKIWVK